MIILVKDDPKLQEDSLTAQVGQHIYKQGGKDYYFICSLSDYVVLRTSHNHFAEQMTSLPDEVSETFRELAFSYDDGLAIAKELKIFLVVLIITITTLLMSSSLLKTVLTTQMKRCLSLGM